MNSKTILQHIPNKDIAEYFNFLSCLIVLGQILVNIGCGLSSYLLYRYLRYLAAGRFSH
ncbi:hypothetical protein [Richelia sinica]|uniref:hypothetical protein n=1 Tax=Richelia sinica TaxID=1357545 RepID=UPI001C2BE6BC|nr:hypothetical protein [Richelia sinica]